jgi:hypothetical protein
VIEMMRASAGCLTCESENGCVQARNEKSATQVSRFVFYERALDKPISGTRTIDCRNCRPEQWVPRR